MRPDSVDGMGYMDKMADVNCSKLEIPAGCRRMGVNETDKMRDARRKRADEMESADEMEIWGVRWNGRDGKIVPALN